MASDRYDALQEYVLAECSLKSASQLPPGYDRLIQSAADFVSSANQDGGWMWDRQEITISSAQTHQLELTPVLLSDVGLFQNGISSCDVLVVDSTDWTSLDYKPWMEARRHPQFYGTEATATSRQKWFSVRMNESQNLVVETFPYTYPDAASKSLNYHLTALRTIDEPESPDYDDAFDWPSSFDFVIQDFVASTVCSARNNRVKSAALWDRGMIRLRGRLLTSGVEAGRIWLPQRKVDDT